MSTEALDAVRMAIEKQLDALKIVEKKDVEISETDAVKTDEVSNEVSPKRTHKHYRSDEERRQEWDEIQKTKEVKQVGVKGTVRWYSVLGHYGFIKPDDGGDDLFVHQSAISKSKIEKYYLRTLADDEPVEFNVVLGPKGLEAADVTGPDGSDVQGSRAFRMLLRRTRMHPRNGARSAHKSNVNKNSGNDVPADEAENNSEKNHRRTKRRFNKGKLGQKGTSGDEASPAEHTAVADGSVGDAGDAGLGTHTLIPAEL